MQWKHQQQQKNVYTQYNELWTNNEKRMKQFYNNFFFVITIANTPLQLQPFSLHTHIFLFFFFCFGNI